MSLKYIQTEKNGLLAVEGTNHKAQLRFLKIQQILYQSILIQNS